MFCLLDISWDALKRQSFSAKPDAFKFFFHWREICKWVNTLGSPNHYLDRTHLSPAALFQCKHIDTFVYLLALSVQIPIVRFLVNGKVRKQIFSLLHNIFPLVSQKFGNNCFFQMSLISHLPKLVHLSSFQERW